MIRLTLGDRTWALATSYAHTRQEWAIEFGCCDKGQVWDWIPLSTVRHAEQIFHAVGDWEKAFREDPTLPERLAMEHSL